MPPDLPGVRAQGLASLGVWPCSPRPWGLRGAQEGLRVTPGFQETCLGGGPGSWCFRRAPGDGGLETSWAVTGLDATVVLGCLLGEELPLGTRRRVWF